MRITGNNVVRAGLIEMLLFETKRLLRPLPPSEQKSQFGTIARGSALVEESGLWIRFKYERALERLCGFAASRRTVKRAVDDLVDREFVWSRYEPDGRVKRRQLLLNVRHINRAIEDLECYSGDEWQNALEVVPGSPSIIVMPDVKFHALYPTLVSALSSALQSTKKDAPARASMMLLQVLWLADERHQKGQSAESRWTWRDTGSRMMFGDGAGWQATIDLLAAARLVRRRTTTGGDVLLEPDLAGIKAAIAATLETSLSDANSEGVTNPSTTGDKSERGDGQILAEPWTNPGGEDDNPVPGPGITELFAEPVADVLREREISQESSSVDLSSLPDPNLGARKSLLRQSGAPGGLHRFRLDELAKSDPGKAQALVELSDEIIHGELPALAFFGSTEQSVVLAAMVVGLLVDMNVLKESPLWIAFPQVEQLISGDLNDPALKQLRKDAVKQSNLLVVQGVEQASRKDSRNLVRSAISARKGKAPILFCDISRDLHQLASRGENGPELALEISDILRVESDADLVRRLFAA